MNRLHITCEIVQRQLNFRGALMHEGIYQQYQDGVFFYVINSYVPKMCAPGREESES